MTLLAPFLLSDKQYMMGCKCCTEYSFAVDPDSSAWEWGVSTSVFIYESLCRRLTKNLWYEQREQLDSGGGGALSQGGHD